MTNTQVNLQEIIKQSILGESDTRCRLDGMSLITQADQHLLAQARREVLIRTPNLEPDRYNHSDFINALSSFLRSSRYAQAQILVGDTKLAIRWGHQLVTLARRLPSRLHIRQLADNDFDHEEKRQEAWLLADAIGLVRREGAKSDSAWLHSKAIPEGKHAKAYFKECWERSRRIPDFEERPL
jgi:hypothetical protein